MTNTDKAEGLDYISDLILETIMDLKIDKENMLETICRITTELHNTLAEIREIMPPCSITNI